MVLYISLFEQKFRYLFRLIYTFDKEISNVHYITNVMAYSYLELVSRQPFRIIDRFGFSFSFKVTPCMLVDLSHNILFDKTSKCLDICLLLV